MCLDLSLLQWDFRAVGFYHAGSTLGKKPAHTDAYLAVAPACKKNIALQDQYVPDGKYGLQNLEMQQEAEILGLLPYLDVFITLNELGSFSLLYRWGGFP